MSDNKNIIDYMKKAQAKHKAFKALPSNRFFEIKNDGSLGAFLPTVLASEVAAELKVIFVSEKFIQYKNGVFVPINKGSKDKSGGAIVIKKYITEKLLAEGINVQVKMLDDTIHLLKAMYHTSSESMNYQQRKTKNKLIASAPDFPYLNFKNCMFSMMDKRDDFHDPSFLSTWQFPVKYDPEATCPNYDKWISEALPEDGIRQLHQWFGYLLFPTAQFQKAAVFMGVPKTGKSVIISVQNGLIGDELTSHCSWNEIESDPYAMADLDGKFLNTCADISGTKLVDTEKFKQVVSGDPMRARQIYTESHNAKHFVRLSFSTNFGIPRSDDRSGAVERRLITFGFNKVIETPIAGYYEKYIEPELSGILNHALKGWRELQEQGEFSISEHTKQTLSDYSLANDEIAEFIQHKCMTGEPNLKITPKELHEAYKAWREEEYGDEGRPLGKKVFYADIMRKGYEKKHSNNGDIFTGITTNFER